MLAARPVDFRKGLDSLAALVAQVLASDVYTGDIFIFRSKRLDRLKLLIWERLRAMSRHQAIGT